MDKASANSAKKKSNWRRFFIVCGAILAVNAVLIALALNWVRGVVSDFELHAPQTALNRYIDNLFGNDDEEIMRTSGFVPDENNTWEEYLGILRQRFSPAREEFSYRLTAATELADGEEMYGIYSGQNKLGEVILSPDETTDIGWAARSPVSYLDGYTITAPPGVQVIFNGKPLPAESHTGTVPVRVEYYRGDELASIDMFTKMYNQSLAPVLYRYETPKTLVEPVFSATSPHGQPQVQVDAERRTVLIPPPLSAEQEQLAAQTMEIVARAYSDFITEDGTLANLLQYVHAETELDSEFREYQRGWYLDHEKREFSEFTFSDIAFHSDTCFTGHVDFDTYITFKGELQTFKASYDMAFMLLDGSWQLVGLHARSA